MKSFTILLLSALACCAPQEKPVPRPATVELFDGETLDGWRTLAFELGGGAAASVGADGTLQLAAGEPMAPNGERCQSA